MNLHALPLFFPYLKNGAEIFTILLICSHYSTLECPAINDGPLSCCLLVEYRLVVSEIRLKVFNLSQENTFVS